MYIYIYFSKFYFFQRNECIFEMSVSFQIQSYFLNVYLCFCYLLNLIFKMIDYLISDNKKFGLLWSCILNVINFLIFRDFWIFLEFILDIFGFIWVFKIENKHFYTMH